MFNNGEQVPTHGNEKTKIQIELESKLRQIILENEGDRDDIYCNVLRFVKPLVDGLVDISEPIGAYSMDPLQHANNTIQNCTEIAKGLLDDLTQ